MKYLLSFSAFFLLSLNLTVEACTSIIISGKSTPDGRPIMWKNRDTDTYQNAIKYFDDGKYASIGLIDSDDPSGESVWIGYNSAGFAIMNTASYNLIMKDSIDLKDQEGIVMREALMQCATVAEFETFLNNHQKPLGVEANFGVIDAVGGAAYFEVSNFSYKKLDVNDPALAPMGYMIHTNFSFTGDPNSGSGQIRYKTAEDLFYQAAQQNNLTVRFILQDVSRSLYHSLTKTDLMQSSSENPEGQKYVNFTDFIPRYFSSAAVVIQGVKTGENVDFTTMWAVLGFPLTSVVTPLWLCMGEKQPALVTLDNNGVAPLCDKAIQLKKQLFPIKKSYGENYININALYNVSGIGIMQKLTPLDDMIFEKANKNLDLWRNNINFKQEIPEFYRFLDQEIGKQYMELFGI
ncbi:MAG: carcinine hydrolase/isopenicillin-N N-acyltransferase family protein [Bacteroidales bacterium]